MEWHLEGYQTTELTAAILINTSHLTYVNGNSDILRKNWEAELLICGHSLLVGCEKDGIKVDPDGSLGSILRQ